jgi:hypothetical protein
MNVSMDKRILWKIVACVIISAVFSVMFVGYLGKAQLNLGPVEDKLELSDFLALEKENNLDIYLKVTNNGNQATSINELKINGVPQNLLPDTAFFLNGSSIDNKNTQLINLGRGESVNIEVIVPKASFSSSSDLGLTRVDVLTPRANFYVESQSLKPLTRDVS